MPVPASRRTAVVAVGGNALTREGQAGTYTEQWRNATRTALAICRLVETGYRVILTHGNGPQVGSLSIQQEEGSRFVPPQPLSELVAMTQGALGNLLSLALRNASGGALPVVFLIPCVIIMVLVGLMGFELIQSSSGYKQAGFLTRTFGELLGQKVK